MTQEWQTVKRRRRRWPAYQGYGRGGARNSGSNSGRPHQGDPNFSALVKALFQIIQCLHHIQNSIQQQEGSLNKAFSQKLNELNQFIKPALPNSAIKSVISGINSGWMKQIIAALSSHYSDSLAKLKKNVTDMNLNHLDTERAQQLATEWAHKNFKKKLRKETLSKFRNICQTLFKSGHKPRVNERVTPDRSKQNSSKPGPSGIRSSLPKVSNPPSSLTFFWEGNLASERSNPDIAKNPSVKKGTLSQPMDSANPGTQVNSKGGTSKKSKLPEPVQVPQQNLSACTQNLSTPFSPVRPAIPDQPSTPAGPTTPNSSPIRTPGNTSVPSPGTPLTPSPQNSPKIQAGAQIGPTSVPRTPFKAYRANQSNRKDTEWEFKKCQAKTLIVGTSQLSQITESRDPTLDIRSYPGMKFKHLKVLMDKAIKTNSEPSSVILSCGINDRCNKPDTTIFGEFRKVVNKAREAFPRAKLFYAMPNWSGNLPSTETKNLEKFSEMVGNSGTDIVNLIPPISPDLFEVGPDNIHWTPTTANNILDHWLSHLN